MSSEKPVLEMTDVEYRVIIEHRLTRLELLNILQAAALAYLIFGRPVGFMLGAAFGWP